VATYVEELLKHTTSPLEVKWGEIKLGRPHVLSSALTVTGRELKDTTIPEGIQRRYEQYTQMREGTQMVHHGM
jgi:hypothetical protein